MPRLFEKWINTFMATPTALGHRVFGRRSGACFGPVRSRREAETKIPRFAAEFGAGSVGGATPGAFPV
jgi:hypothetical protein